MAVEFCSRLLDDLPDALIVTDLNGIIQIWNRRSESIFNFSKAQAIGKSLDIIIPESLRAAHWAGFYRAISSDDVKFKGVPIRTKAMTGNGDAIYLAIAFSLTHDEDGHLVGVTAVARLAP